MAVSFVSYSQPNIGSLGKYIGGKIKSAAAMAAEERKSAKEDAERKRKEGVPEEEIKKYDKGYFFGKALSHEFGGDLLRRTRGTFSKDPTAEQDPSLSKQQRFSAVARGSDVVSPEPFKQLELPLNQAGNNAVKVEDKSLKSWLSVVFDGIQKSYDTISDKIGNLSQEEKKDTTEDVKTSKTISKLATGLTTIKSFFNKNNKIQQEENKLESEQLELNLDAQNQQEMNIREADIERGDDLSGNVAYKDPYAKDDEEDGGGGGGEDGSRSLLDRLMDFDMDRRGRFRRKGFKRRYARRKIGGFTRNLRKGGRRLRRRGQVGFGKLGRVLRRFKLSEGGVVPQNQTTNILSTQVQSPENSDVQSSVSPQNKIVPSPRTKLSAGGIVDNPTQISLSPGQSVIPLNRNNPMKDMFRQTKTEGKKKDATGKNVGEQLGKALQLPAQAAGGLLLSTMSNVFKRIGGIGKMFAPFLMQLFSPIARVFGLPANLIGALLGGQPAAAATLDIGQMADFLKGGGGKKGKKASVPSAPTPPPTGNLSAAPSGKETDIQSLTGGTPIDLSASSTVSDTGLHHGNEDTRRGKKVRDYFIGGRSGPSNGIDGLGAKLYSPLGFGPLKYVDYGPHGIAFQDPNTGEQVGMYWHVNDPQHQLNGQVIQPGTFVGTQGGLPGTPSAAPGSSSVHLHVEGTEAFHNAVIKTYADGNILKVAGGQTGAHQLASSNQPSSNIASRQPQPSPNGAAARPQSSSTPNRPSSPGTNIFLNNNRGGGGAVSPPSPQPQGMAFSLSSFNPAAPMYGNGNW